jgi:acyl carrier protein phosphodiesterase
VTETTLADVEQKRIAGILTNVVTLHVNDMEKERGKKTTPLERTLQHIEEKIRTRTASPEERALFQRLVGKATTAKG